MTYGEYEIFRLVKMRRPLFEPVKRLQQFSVEAKPDSAGKAGSGAQEAGAAREAQEHIRVTQVRRRRARRGGP